ncbi:MAG: ABC transporter substrate-binding protein [Treponema sp.]|nr:ABC transporter substrate-binding protein [Treponema sp.]
MKMNKKISAVLLGALALAVLASCSSDDPVALRKKALKKLYEEKGTVKIAVANSYQTNISSEWNGIELAQEVIEKEDILGKKLEVVKFDDGGTAITGSNTAYKICSDNEICAVIGHGYSDISIPASTIYQYYGILMFNTSSTAPRLTMNNNPLIVRNIPDDNLLGKRAAELCAEKKFGRVLIYYLDMAAANSLANSFEFNSIEKKITVVSRDSYELTTSEADFNEVFEKWKNDFIFDAVLLAGTNPGIGTIVKQMRQCGITCPVIGADSFEDNVFKKQFGSEENGRIFAVTNFNQHSEYQPYREFRDAYVAKYSMEPDYEAMQAYDAMMVLARSIHMAGSSQPEDIVTILKGELWKEAAGPYSFTQSGDIKNNVVYKKEFLDGEFVLVTKKDM